MHFVRRVSTNRASVGMLRSLTRLLARRCCMQAMSTDSLIVTFESDHSLAALPAALPSNHLNSARTDSAAPPVELRVAVSAPQAVKQLPHEPACGASLPDEVACARPEPTSCPREPQPSECCGNGCERCVWSEYSANLQLWHDRCARQQSSSLVAVPQPP